MTQPPLAPSPPPAPEFGDLVAPMASQAALELLARRRSTSAQLLMAPGPDDDQLQDLLRLAARAPDHGKLFPWRFIVLRGPAKADFACKLEDLARTQADPEKALIALRKLSAPPVAVCVVSRVQGTRIPEWEQVLSAGSVCTLLLLAAQAMGFGANWITDWYSYDPGAGDLLGLGAGERVAGFVYLGTPTETPLERVRPDLAELITNWTA